MKTIIPPKSSVGTIVIDGVATDFHVATTMGDYDTDQGYNHYIACHCREEGYQPVVNAQPRSTFIEAEADALNTIVRYGQMIEMQSELAVHHVRFVVLQNEIANIKIVQVRLETTESEEEKNNDLR